MSWTQLSSHNVNKVFDSLRSFLQSWLIFPSPTSYSTQRAPVPRSQPGFADSVLPPNRPIQLHLQHRQQNGAAFCANYTATPDRDIPIVQNTNMQIHTRRDAPRKSRRRRGRLPLEMMISTSEIASYSDAADVEAGSSVKGSVRIVLLYSNHPFSHGYDSFAPPPLTFACPAGSSGELSPTYPDKPQGKVAYKIIVAEEGDYGQA